MSVSKVAVAMRGLGGLLLGALLTCGCSGSDPDVAGDAGSPVPSTQEALEGPIDVISATYGTRCGVSRGNATASVATDCDHRTNCSYLISTDTLGDPALGCAKDFDVDFACGTVNTANSGRVTISVTQEANGKTVSLSCGQVVSSHLITVQDATYGQNCGAPFNNAGWDVGPYCNGWGQCKYVVSSANLGDPAHGCDKQFTVNYQCSDSTELKTATLAAEADLQQIWLDCP